MTGLSSTIVIAVPFLWLRDGTHPLAVGPVNPGLCQDRADQTGSAGGCQELGPGRQAGNRTTSTASAASQVRPGPRLRRYAQTAAKPGRQDSCRSFSDPPCQYGRQPVGIMTAPNASGNGCSARIPSVRWPAVVLTGLESKGRAFQGNCGVTARVLGGVWPACWV